MCVSVGLNPELETPGFLKREPQQGSLEEDGASRERARGADGSRPTDVYLPRWRAGMLACGLRADTLNTAAAEPGAVTTRYEHAKCVYRNTKSHCQDKGFTFTPLVLEACGGGWGVDASLVVAELAKTMTDPGHW